MTETITQNRTREASLYVNKSKDKSATILYCSVFKLKYHIYNAAITGRQAIVIQIK